MKHKYILFSKVEHITQRINSYFTYIQGQYHTEMLPFKPSAKSPPELREQKVWDREPQPPTLSGLALYLGFESRQAFEAYEQNGRFATILKRARLQIENEYEKQLYHQPSTGAIFALKTLGWADKPAAKYAEKPDNNTTLKIEVVVAGPSLAGNEHDVAL